MIGIAVSKFVRCEVCQSSD